MLWFSRTSFSLGVINNHLSQSLRLDGVSDRGIGEARYESKQYTRSWSRTILNRLPPVQFFTFWSQTVIERLCPLFCVQVFIHPYTPFFLLLSPFSHLLLTRRDTATRQPRYSFLGRTYTCATSGDALVAYTTIRLRSLKYASLFTYPTQIALPLFLPHLPFCTPVSLNSLVTSIDLDRHFSSCVTSHLT